MDNKKVILSLKNLKQYFNIGVGSNKLVVKAIDDVSFDIYEGEVFGLVGESGCGKTTTGRTAIKIYNPTDGEIEFMGEKIASGIQSNTLKIKELKNKCKEEVCIKVPISQKLLKHTRKNMYQSVMFEQENVGNEQNVCYSF